MDIDDDSNQHGSGSDRRYYLACIVVIVVAMPISLYCFSRLVIDSKMPEQQQFVMFAGVLFGTGVSVYCAAWVMLRRNNSSRKVEAKAPSKQSADALRGNLGEKAGASKRSNRPNPSNSEQANRSHSSQRALIPVAGTSSNGHQQSSLVVGSPRRNRWWRRKRPWKRRGQHPLHHGHDNEASDGDESNSACGPSTAYYIALWVPTLVAILNYVAAGFQSASHDLNPALVAFVAGVYACLPCLGANWKAIEIYEESVYPIEQKRPGQFLTKVRQFLFIISAAIPAVIMLLLQGVYVGRIAEHNDYHLSPLAIVTVNCISALVLMLIAYIASIFWWIPYLVLFSPRRARPWDSNDAPKKKSGWDN